jgi:hypothetical protein
MRETVKPVIQAGNWGMSVNVEITIPSPSMPVDEFQRCLEYAIGEWTRRMLTRSRNDIPYVFSGVTDGDLSVYVASMGLDCPLGTIDAYERTQDEAENGEKRVDEITHQLSPMPRR